MDSLVVTGGSQNCISDFSRFELTVSGQAKLLVDPECEDLIGQILRSVGTGIVSHTLAELLSELLVQAQIMTPTIFHYLIPDINNGSSGTSPTHQ